MAREWLPHIRALYEVRDVQGLVGQLGAGFHETGDAREALADIGPEAAPPLIGALDHPDAEVRQYAALALGDIGEQSARPALLALFAALGPVESIKGPQYAVWSATAQALGALRATEITESLIAALAVDDIDVQQDACLALGLLGDARAIQPLIAVTKRDDWPVAAWASDALRRFDYAEAQAASQAYTDSQQPETPPDPENSKRVRAALDDALADSRSASVNPRRSQ